MEFGLGISSGLWMADDLVLTHARDGKRFVVRTDEELTAFVALDAAIGVGRELA